MWSQFVQFKEMDRPSDAQLAFTVPTRPRPSWSCATLREALLFDLASPMTAEDNGLLAAPDHVERAAVQRGARHHHGHQPARAACGTWTEVQERRAQRQARGVGAGMYRALVVECRHKLDVLALRMYIAIHWLRVDTFYSVELSEVCIKRGSLWRKTERGRKGQGRQAGAAGMTFD